MTNLLLYTATTPEFNEDVSSYLVKRIPQMNSDFGKNLRDLMNNLGAKELNSINVRSTFIPELTHRGYDFLVSYNESSVIGSLGYQKLEKEWKVFDVYIKDEHRRMGHAATLTKEIIERAKDSNVKSVQFGNEKHEALDSLVIKLFSGRPDMRLIGRTVHIEPNPNYFCVAFPTKPL